MGRADCYITYSFFVGASVPQEINNMNKAILAIFAILAFVPDNIGAEDPFDFKIVDENGDGQLSLKEIAAFLNKDELNEDEKEYFDTLDTNGDGFLQPEEVLPETRAFRSEEKEDTNDVKLRQISINGTDRAWYGKGTGHWNEGWNCWNACNGPTGFGGSGDCNWCGQCDGGPCRCCKWNEAPGHRVFDCKPTSGGLFYHACVGRE